MKKPDTPNNIPRIIHQLWSGEEKPLPEDLKILSETWKEYHPDWSYELWDNNRINSFIKQYYPNYWNIYSRFPYNVQRWNAVRYLILDKMGGMYIDVDYKSLSPIDDLIENKTYCFAEKPESHCKVFKRTINQVFNNAMMLSIPEHPFIRKVIKTVFREETLRYNASKELCVYNTTGPWMLIDLYCGLTEEEKEEIYLIPSQYVTPFDVSQAHRAIKGVESEELEQCLENTYALHYFWGGWRQ